MRINIFDNQLNDFNVILNKLGIKLPSNSFNFLAIIAIDLSSGLFNETINQIIALISLDRFQYFVKRILLLLFHFVFIQFILQSGQHSDGC
jgi:hypothetical protein